ncbi:MAG: dihydropteroate synthase [Holosporaceae bacterium]|jgi:2-amino-4-hydroxy-6-hydroxymethyldihydropteridine diphosphokinase/dihydropteroate synthase|nr:dihydropteroate synthase [Holosporaceae bacterium]
MAEAILLGFGTNLGDRLENFRKAIAELQSYCKIEKISHIIETEALLLENSPPSWNIPFLNMVASAYSNLSPNDLLTAIKKIEKKLGRDMNAPRWSPRVIDIDIIRYGERKINNEQLIIPHKELKNRDFWQFSLEEIGYGVEAEIALNLSNYTVPNHFVLYPKFIGIVNVTPDSFSDGGNFFDPVKAEQHVRKLWNDGASIVDIGAQSTRPGYIEISPQEEISRLSEVLERCNDIPSLSVDTYFDEVVDYVLRKNVKWINDQNSKFRPETIKLIADKNVKLVVMLHGIDFSWFGERTRYLENLGVRKENMIIDPGIGFGKTKQENMVVIRKLKELRQLGYKILLGASRKSFLSAYSNAEDKDLESIAVANAAIDFKVDYLRVHNVKDHMRFFVVKQCISGVQSF